MAFSALLTALLHAAVNNRDADRFSYNVGTTSAGIANRLEMYTSMLRGGTALFAARDDVSHEEFARFVNRLELPARYPGIQGIGFTRRLQPDELGPYTDRVRARAGPAADFTVWPPGERDEYHAIEFLEPPDERNVAALGYDMFTDPVRREAMERARDTGIAAASGKVVLVQETGEDVQSGFLIYAPVYRGGRIPGTVEERRDALLGFVYGAFRAGDLLSAIFGAEENPRTDFRFFGGPAADAGAEMYNSVAPGAPLTGRLTAEERIDIAGQSFVLELGTRPEFEFASGRVLVPIVFLGSALAASLLAGLVLLQSRARAAAERSAADANQERQRYATTLASIGDAVIATDARAAVVFINPVAQALTGWSADEARGVHIDNVFRLIDEDTREPIEPPTTSILRDGLTVGLAARTLLARRDGSTIPIDDSGAPIRRPGRPGRAGAIVGAVLVFRDVSERRRAEERLGRQARVLESMAEGVSLADENGVIHYTNAAEDAMFGYDPGELLGRHVTVLNAYPPEENARIVADVIARLKAGGAWTGEWHNRRKDGSTFFTRARISALDVRGKQHWICVHEDITHRRRAEDALRQSEEKFRLIVESATSFAIFTTDTRGLITSWNPGAQRVLGWSEDEVLGRDARIIFTPEDRLVDQPSIEITEALLTGEGEDNRWHLRKDGTRFWGAGLMMPLRDESGALRGFLKILRDRTDERLAEEARLHFQALFESAPGLYLVLAPDLRIVAASNAYLDATHLAREEIIGRPISTIFPDSSEHTTDDSAERLLASLERVRRTRVADIMPVLRFPVRRPERDGGGLEDRYWSPINSPVLDPRAELVYIIHRVEDVTDYIRAKGAQGHDDEARRELESRAKLMESEVFLRAQDIQQLNRRLQDANTELARQRSHLEEMVAARTKELEVSHERLRVSERMAALGTLSAGLGHDMGNLLLPARTRLEALESLDLPGDARADLAAIGKVLDYLGRMTQGLRMLAVDPHADAAPGESLDVREWWQEVAPLFKDLLPPGTALDARFADGASLRIAISRPSLTQAVFNLVQNAGDALRTRPADAPPAHVTLWAEPADDPAFVRLGVTDNGPGMPPDIQRRVFEPFFTTKTRRISTGLGLSLVHGIIRRAGGRIDLDSAPSRGTTFTLTLPAPASTNGSPARGHDPDAPIAAVQLADARTAGFVTSVLNSCGFQTRRLSADAPTPDTAAPDAALWFTQPHDGLADAATRFLAAHPDRLILLLGDYPHTPKPDRLIELPPTLNPPAIRQAATEAARRIAT